MIACHPPYVASVHRGADSYIPPEKYSMIHDAVLQACDAHDAVKDGVLEDPTRCHFDPKVLECKGADSPSCLTSAQVETARALRRKFAATCLDWSERRDHLGGALGAALAERLVDLGWIARKRNSRAVSVTEAGRRRLTEEFRLEL